MVVDCEVQITGRLENIPIIEEKARFGKVTGLRICTFVRFQYTDAISMAYICIVACIHP